MSTEAFDHQAVQDAFQSGVPVRFDLASPCRSFDRGIECGLTEAYIIVKPWGTSFHYERSCAAGHMIDNVKHAEVELHFGIPKTEAQKKTTVRDALTPPKRVLFNCIIRDNSCCVYCGRRAGEVGLDGSTVVVGADHIIAKALIDPEWIRRDRELFLFARDLQLVTACREHNSTKATMLVDLDLGRELFVRHVLKNETRGVNLGRVAMFERLHRIVALNLRIGRTTSAR